MRNINESEKQQNLEDDLLAEYNFDYKKARPNRFATSPQKITIILDEDVAKVFKSSEDVNKALRAILSAIPKN